MNVASLELSKELYELSGWDTGKPWNIIRGFKPELYVPAYDLGYLLRKLPRQLAKSTQVFDLTPFGTGWVAMYDGENKPLASADTPEDAAAKLAIELFKQGVLTRDGDV